MGVFVCFVWRARVRKLNAKQDVFDYISFGKDTDLPLRTHVSNKDQKQPYGIHSLQFRL